MKWVKDIYMWYPCQYANTSGTDTSKGRRPRLGKRRIYWNLCALIEKKYRTQTTELSSRTHRQQLDQNKQTNTKITSFFESMKTSSVKKKKTRVKSGSFFAWSLSSSLSVGSQKNRTAVGRRIILRLSRRQTRRRSQPTSTSHTNVALRVTKWQTEHLWPTQEGEKIVLVWEKKKKLQILLYPPIILHCSIGLKNTYFDVSIWYTQCTVIKYLCSQMHGDRHRDLLLPLPLLCCSNIHR